MAITLGFSNDVIGISLLSTTQNLNSTNHPILKLKSLNEVKELNLRTKETPRNKLEKFAAGFLSSC